MAVALQPSAMIRGIVEAASAMVSRSRQHDVTANNLANAGTAGFKRQSIFLRQLNRAQGTDVPPAPNKLPSPTAAANQSRLRDTPWLRPLHEELFTDYSQGTLEASENPLNLAIEGSGFFVIETPEGERYTRNGAFSLNEEGVLITANGYAVVGDGGPITLPPGEFVVGDHGELLVDGEQVDTLRVVDFADPGTLRPIGRGLFFATQPAETIETSQVRQGYLERANFELVSEMVRMMTSFRYFETAQKAVQIQDETLGRTVNQVGKIQR
jgi:flagellar basal-body rod protein FlgG